LILIAFMASATAVQQSLWKPLESVLDRNRREIDPHSNDLHCVDVSTYEMVMWDEVPRKKCTAKFPKVVKTKSKNLCEDVTTLECKVIGYTKCEMEMVPLPYTGNKMVRKMFDQQVCTEKLIKEKHKKRRPKCEEVTKQNCVTKWEILPTGEKVWSGNEDCKPVTWEDCSLEEYEVEFEVPKVTCKPIKKIPWKDCEDTKEEQMTFKMTCEPYSAVECKPVTNQLCVFVQWEESHQEVQPICTDVNIDKPRQLVSHKKLCLLPDTQTKLPNGPLQPLKPKEKLEQNIFPGPVRSGRNYDTESRPSPIFESEE